MLIIELQRISFGFALYVSLLFFHTSGQFHEFDASEATVDSVHQSLFSGQSNCRAVVSAFLARIELYNPKINALISLNPTSLVEADEKDKMLSVGNATGTLFCIPIILKDNFDLAGLSTTGGCRALRNTRPIKDAPSVAALKRAGAIVVGKANMHEMALEGLSVSSLGGQTLNPYDFTRTPGGSSGGTGAAIAASFAVFGTGTDTMNSLRNPASANSLFSIRPTRGLVTRAGVIPVSYTQDALGIIARSTRDVAIGLTAMKEAGFDALDNTTAVIPDKLIHFNFADALKSPAGVLHTSRIGILETFFDRVDELETFPVNKAMSTMIQRLKVAGVSIVSINESRYDAAAILSKLDTQHFEYRESIDRYLQHSNSHGDFPRSFHQLYSTNNTSGRGSGNGRFLVTPKQYAHIKISSISSTANATYTDVKQCISDLILSLASTFSHNNLDAIIYPQQRNLVVKIGSASQKGRNGILAAVTGYPVVTVPAGFSQPTDEAPLGVPIGMEILGRPWSEELLLKLAYEIENLGPIRKRPKWAKNLLESKDYGITVPELNPSIENIPVEYPIGIL